MTDAAYSSALACPGCGAAPAALEAAAARTDATGVPLRRVELSLPEIHCAACITGVEDTLLALPGMRAARVNLSLRRVSATVEDLPGAEARLLSALRRRGFTAHPLDSAVLAATRTDAEGRQLLARLGVAGFASMNVMLLSVAVWAGAADTTRELLHWVAAAITVPAVAFSAQPFFRNAFAALRAGRMDMDIPIATSILMALWVSIQETWLSGHHAFFEAAIGLTFFLLIGRYLQHVGRAAARSAATELAALEVHTAERVTSGGARESVPTDALRIGDCVAVPAGGRIPVDGTVTSGRSEIDSSLLTGETLPQIAEEGTLLRAGMMNLSGPLTVRVTTLGQDTLLGEISRLVETAEQSRSRYATLADRAARAYAPFVNVLALAALLLWGFGTGDWRLALTICAAVLIITCPCGLGLAVPAVLTAASGKLFRAGILLKDGSALEKLAEVDTVIFDKTGTLTTGRPVLTNADDIPAEAFALAAALAEGSSHPLSRAICRAAELRGILPASLSDIAEHPGRGLAARAGATPIRLGRAEWLGLTHAQNETASWLQVGDAAPIPLLFRDEPRADAADTVAALKARGLRILLLSGDAEGPVADLVRRVGIDDWLSGATPAEKVARIDALRQRSGKVLMVGDGLNDTAALAAAHVSMSPASAVDASRSAADFIILGDSLDRVAFAHATARTTRRRILENFVLAFCYNFITVPTAFAGLVTPLFAAIFMSASSLTVCLNALRMGERK